MRKVILFYLFGAFLYSCTKEGGNVSAEGRVYNPITGEGYEGFEIKLTEDTHIGGAPGAQSSDSRTISSVKSDSDGNYSLSGVALGVGATLRFFTDHSEFYKIGIGNNTVTGEPNEYSTIGLKSGKHNKVDFWVVPYGTLYTHVQNINCEGGFDSMIYRWKAPFKEWTTYWSNWHVGCVDVLYDGEASKQTPMGWHSHEIRVIRNGIETRFFDSIFVYPNEVHTFELNY